MFHFQTAFNTHKPAISARRGGATGDLWARQHHHHHTQQEVPLPWEYPWLYTPALSILWMRPSRRCSAVSGVIGKGVYPERRRRAFHLTVVCHSGAKGQTSDSVPVVGATGGNANTTTTTDSRTQTFTIATTDHTNRYKTITLLQ